MYVSNEQTLHVDLRLIEKVSSLAVAELPRNRGFTENAYTFREWWSGGGGERGGGGGGGGTKEEAATLSNKFCFPYEI